ncbi:transposase family protein [Novispirillum itersonii]|uniref:Transposase n=1 Tax=Novispirillum itersonii TaxID=189 RepID=A0A7W9ZDN6_NOVIT|nr:transposase family protein [Novispirillum itersonii]MBB6209330.1 transposase [Novispirillum itersonii]
METIQRRKAERREIWVYLGREPGAEMICDGCGKRVDRVHDVDVRTIRDLPILDAAAWLSVPRRRVLCPYFGIRSRTPTNRR